MRTTLTALFLAFQTISIAQTTISGTVTDKWGTTIEGANVYLDGTYDGASTDDLGRFSFTTAETGVLTLKISFLAYETASINDDVSKLNKLTIVLREAVNTLSAVTLTAGTFEAGDNSKVSVLKPLDVVTTASALGDFVGALQTLPGTTTVAEDGRLFVRGGQAEETQIFIDGVRVFTPFSPTANNIPTRGRYSPFLFKGITFSTGGYSAEYGQALSGILQLNTIDEPDQEKTDISLMTVGGGIGHTKKWENNSLSINASYIDLAPYLAVFSDRNEWKKPFQGLAAEAVFRQKYESGLLKLYAATDYSNFDVIQDDINLESGLPFALKNQNVYINGSFRYFFDNDWTLSLGASYTGDHTDLKIIEGTMNDDENSFHFKAKVKKGFSSRFKLNFGAEYFTTDFKEEFISGTDAFNADFTNGLSAVFAEADVFLSNDLAFKAGLRAEHTALLDETSFSPRMSLAYKAGDFSQFSLAYGDFSQNPLNQYLKFDKNLESERATHYLLNYQFSREKKIFRAEVFHKEYNKLVKYDTGFVGPNSNFDNNGFGYARGLDIFWRDGKTIKNLEYWISYSFLDTKRDYQNFPEKATPGFAPAHNASVVGKYWLGDWKSQLGLSYTFASGRPYTDPNTNDFLSERTKTYNSLSFNWAYLISQQKILYFSVNNVLGTKNIFGYDYANTRNLDGVFDRQAIRPNADQFFFVGFFWTISTDKKSNQLDNL